MAIWVAAAATVLALPPAPAFPQQRAVDTGIAVWYFKRRYDAVRPFSAIRYPSAAGPSPGGAAPGGVPSPTCPASSGAAT